ncbi:snRNA-activating protein complex subunit 2-like isoform X2 [Anser cygnoides]|uniref:snRNA-activating protein complex subunit 2-like isoform X2 n=1 Tax=Anser cygnoides TaxID=8845 RepID=UPI0034D34E2F
MKPPPRPRLVPARFAEAPAGRPRAAAWSLREKRSLLAALRAQAALGLPELQARPLRESLPRRSEAEILGLVSRLRGRAAREAVGTQHRACLEEQRRRRARRPAPIEVWLELAQTLAEGVEEAAAAAFSQGLSCWGHGWIWGPTGVTVWETLSLIPPPHNNPVVKLGAGDFSLSHFVEVLPRVNTLVVSGNPLRPNPFPALSFPHLLLLFWVWVNGIFVGFAAGGR